MTELGPIFVRLGLAQYLEQFLDEGFETWETVLDITESDLDALSVKLGHRRRLQREIATFRGVNINDISSPPARNAIQREVKLDAGDREGPSQADGSRRAKRKYKRHPKSDIHAPDRPQSAYVIFSNKVRDDLKPENLSFTDIAKRVGEMWQALAPDEREPFEAQAASAKEEYLVELAKYKETDFFMDYSEYLADFKANHSSKTDGKKPKLETRASTASSGSIRSQRNSIEPQHHNLPPRPDQASSTPILDHGQQPGRRTTELTSPIISTQSFPSARVSPSTSVTSLASSTRSGFPNTHIQTSTARPGPYSVDAMKNGPTTLPPITTLEPRDPSSSPGSKFWFGYQPGSSTSNISPLSDYRRSYHPPPAFVPTRASSSSQSRSHSADHSDTTVSSTKPRADSQPYRLPPSSSRGLEASQLDGVESSGSNDPLESRVQPVYSQGRPPLSAHTSSSLSNLSLNVATPEAPHHTSSSTRQPATSQSYHTPPDALPIIRRAIEHDVGLQTDVDPLSVLAYAGDIVHRKSRQAC